MQASTRSSLESPVHFWALTWTGAQDPVSFDNDSCQFLLGERKLSDFIIGQINHLGIKAAESKTISVHKDYPKKGEIKKLGGRHVVILASLSSLPLKLIKRIAQPNVFYILANCDSYGWDPLHFPISNSLSIAKKIKLLANYSGYVRPLVGRKFPLRTFSQIYNCLLEPSYHTDPVNSIAFRVMCAYKQTVEMFAKRVLVTPRVEEEHVRGALRCYDLEDSYRLYHELGLSPKFMKFAQTMHLTISQLAIYYLINRSTPEGIAEDWNKATDYMAQHLEVYTAGEITCLLERRYGVRPPATGIWSFDGAELMHFSLSNLWQIEGSEATRYYLQKHYYLGSQILKLFNRDIVQALMQSAELISYLKKHGS